MTWEACGYSVRLGGVLPRHSDRSSDGDAFGVIKDKHMRLSIFVIAASMAYGAIGNLQVRG